MATKHYISYQRYMQRYEPQFGDERRALSEEILDALAEKELKKNLYGNFNVSRSNICSNCHTAKSSNGSCYC